MPSNPDRSDIVGAVVGTHQVSTSGPSRGRVASSTRWPGWSPQIRSVDHDGAVVTAGSRGVVHAVGGATSMDAMGGLRRRIPTTFVTMTLGFGALAGVVPLVGFFTKDAVVHAAYVEASDGRLVWPWVAWLLVGSMVVTAAMTAASSSRVSGSGSWAIHASASATRCASRGSMCCDIRWSLPIA